MKAFSICTTVFLLTSILPAFGQPSEYRQMRWDTNNIKMSDIRFQPDFLILSVPASDSKGAQFELNVQCGNNPNFFYKQKALYSKSVKMSRDKELVTQLCTQATEMRDVYINQLLTTHTCPQINLQYGIRSIPVTLYGDLAKKKDRDRNGLACDLELQPIK